MPNQIIVRQIKSSFKIGVFVEMEPIKVQMAKLAFNAWMVKNGMNKNLFVNVLKAFSR